MLFGFYAMADYNDSTTNIAYASQGGLSLPERAYYLEDREDYKAARAAFVEHVAALMQLAGSDEKTAKAQAQAETRRAALLAAFDAGGTPERLAAQ